MRKVWLVIKNTGGFSLAEAIIAVAVFSIITTSTAASYLKVSNYIQSAGAERQAIFLAEEGLEAVRNIRDNNFSTLTAGGPYGISTSGNVWGIAGSSDAVGIYTRKITITAPDANTWQVASRIEWTFKGENKSLTLNREFTNWRKLKNRDPISLWPFDENEGCIAHDTIGSNDGDLLPLCPTKSPQWITGKINSALFFDGEDDQVSIKDSDSLDISSQMSMVAWVKPSQHKTAKIIEKGDWNGHGLYQDKWDGWIVTFRIGGSSYKINWEEGRPSLDEWYHVVGVYDGTKVSLYVNGEEKNSIQVTGSLNTNNFKVFIGSSGGQKYFNGSIDEAALYDIALAEDEIRDLYEYSPPPEVASIEVLSPNGGNSFVTGSTSTIQWNSVNTSGNVKIEYSKDNFVSDVNLIVGSISDNGSYDWVIPADESATVKIRISDADDAKVFDTSNANFSIALPASILVTNPNGGENLIVDSISTIQWNSVNTSGNVKIEYSKDNFVSDVNLIVGSISDTENFSWSIPNDLSSTVKIRVADIADDAVSDVSDDNFIIAVKPVSLWSLNDNTGCSVSDLFGGNSGSLAPTCPSNSPVWTVGKIGSALSFDGVDDYVSFNNSANLNPTTAITLKAWVKWNINPTTGQQWASIINKNADNQYRLQHNSTNTAFEFAIRTSAGNKWIVSNTIPAQGVWYFVVGTYDGTSLKIYVNGLLENTASFSGNLLSSTNPVTISRHLPTGRFFNGIIDEVSIYSIALSAADILNIYNSQK